MWFNVSSVEDGQEAWDEYQKGRYDLLLLDGDMPKMQGEEVMRLVREAGDDIAIVMYSGLPDYSLLNEGVDECIDKGTRNSQEVEWRIKTAFRRSQERKEMNRLKAPKAEKRKHSGIDSNEIHEQKRSNPKVEFVKWLRPLTLVTREGNRLVISSPPSVRGSWRG